LAHDPKKRKKKNEKGKEVHVGECLCFTVTESEGDPLLVLLFFISLIYFFSFKLDWPPAMYYYAFTYVVVVTTFCAKKNKKARQLRSGVVPNNLLPSCPEVVIWRNAISCVPEPGHAKSLESQNPTDQSLTIIFWWNILYNKA
jgi:hypothetical protein